jgi:O-antigen/teichoic acid export membrane protein
MDKVAMAEFLGKAGQVGFIFAVVKLNLGFSWVVAALLFNMVINFFLVFLWSRKYIKLSLRFNFSYWKRFLSWRARSSVSCRLWVHWDNPMRDGGSLLVTA